MFAPLVLAAAGLAFATAAAADCKPATQSPPGVRAPLPRNCAAPPAAKPFAEETARDKVRAGREPGFVDLGNGSSLKVGGRVRVDVGAGRR